jgi:hypothetical protein
MSGDAQLMLMIAGMHLLGLVVAAALILPALRDRPDTPPGSEGGSDGGGGHGPSHPLAPPTGPGGGLPLPDAAPARVRLRDHNRLGDQLPRRERRPAREPERQPVRAAQ